MDVMFSKHKGRVTEIMQNKENAQGSWKHHYDTYFIN